MFGMSSRPGAEFFVTSSVFSISSTVIILFSLESELSSSKSCELFHGDFSWFIVEREDGDWMLILVSDMNLLERALAVSIVTSSSISRKGISKNVRLLLI